MTYLTNKCFTYIKFKYSLGADTFRMSWDFLAFAMF